MADFPAMTLWTDAYLGDTTHLTTIQHGAYLLLLIAMWRNGGVLPNDDDALAKHCKLRIDMWHRHRPTIMAFFTVEGKWITQKRLAQELARRTKNSAEQGRKARLRWLKRNNVLAAPAAARHMPSDAPHTLSKSSTTTSNESVSVEEGQREKEPAPSPTDGVSPSPAVNGHDAAKNALAATQALLDSHLYRKVAAR